MMLYGFMILAVLAVLGYIVFDAIKEFSTTN